jgi:hypothetical protein
MKGGKLPKQQKKGKANLLPIACHNQCYRQSSCRPVTRNYYYRWVLDYLLVLHIIDNDAPAYASTCNMYFYALGYLLSLSSIQVGKVSLKGHVLLEAGIGRDVAPAGIAVSCENDVECCAGCPPNLGATFFDPGWGGRGSDGIARPGLTRDTLYVYQLHTCSTSILASELTYLTSPRLATTTM